MRAPHRPSAYVLAATVALSGALAPVLVTTAEARPAPVVAAAKPKPKPVRLTQAQATRDAQGVYTLTWKASRSDKVRVLASTDATKVSKGKRVGSSSKGRLVVKGLAPGSRWYFALVPSKGATTVTATRHVPLAGASNVRDLGGYRAVGGRTVRWGMLFRGNALSTLTEADLAVLEGAGLRTVVDLRGPEEIAAKGADRLPAGAVLDEKPMLDEVGSQLSVTIQAAVTAGDPAVLEEMLGDGKAAQLLTTGFSEMPKLDTTRAALTSIFDRLTDSARVPLLYNCTAGKDRTGLASAVILRALGVPMSTIVDDFVLSNSYLAPSNQATYDVLAHYGVRKELVQPLLEQSPAYIEAAFESIDATYGSFDAYLRDQLGVDAVQLKALRSRYLS